MIIPHYEIIINHHHFIQELLTPTPTQPLQALTKLSPGARLDRTSWLWIQSSGMNFPKVQGCAYLCILPSLAEGQRFLISSGESKLQIHPAQPFPSFWLVHRRKLRHSKANWGLQEVTPKGNLFFHEGQSSWLSHLYCLFKDGADLLGLLPWRKVLFLMTAQTEMKSIRRMFGFRPIFTESNLTFRISQNITKI